MGGASAMRTLFTIPLLGVVMLGENLANWLGENAWAIWFSLAVLLAIAETLSLNLVFVMLAAGAAAGGLTALAAPSLWWLQILVSVVISVLTLFLLRPTLIRRVRNMPGYRSAFSSMVGKPGRATVRITASAGEVKIDGQVWSARAFDESMTIEPGVEIEVFEVDGTVAVVYPRHGELGGSGLTDQTLQHRTVGGEAGPGEATTSDGQPGEEDPDH